MRRARISSFGADDHQAQDSAAEGLPIRENEERIIDLRNDGVGCVPCVEDLHYVTKGPANSKHKHFGTIEIIYCRRGHGIEFECGNDLFQISPGDVFFSLPGESHYVKTIPMGYRIYSIRVNISRQWGDSLGLSKDEAAWLRRTLRSMPERVFYGGAWVESAFKRIFKVYDDERWKNLPGRLVCLRAAIMNLLLTVVDVAGSRMAGRPVGKRLAELVRELEEKPLRRLKIADMARKVALSPAQFIVRFRRATGLPPQSYLQTLRIKQAKLDLERTGQSVAAISDRLGYSCASHFITQFKRATGMTPFQWRKKSYDRLLS